MHLAIFALFRIGAGVSVLLLAGCISPPPPEYAIYREAFVQLDATSREALRIFEPIEKASAPVTEGAFIPDEAAYIADEGRPPLTLVIERGFDAVADYNAILVGYASGASGRSLKADAVGFAGNVAVLSGTVGGPGAGAATSAGLAALEMLAGALLEASDRAEFARAVATHSDAVDAFLLELRSTTTDLYNTARDHARGLRNDLLREGRDAEADRVLTEDLPAFRKMLASLVLAIDEARRSIAALERAVIEGRTATISPATLARWTTNINRYAEGARFAAREISDAF